MTLPLLQWTCIAALTDVSIVMRHIFLTLAIDKMLASEVWLYQTSPKLVTVPLCVLSCVPPLVYRRRVLLLCWMLDRYLRFLNTDTVD